jgi:ferredoxin
VISGVDFLRRVNLGEKVELNGKVVVIGGGNVAVDVARTAVRVSTGSVEMYCLESREEMPAAKEETAETLAEKIDINNGWGPAKILSENGKVTGVEFKKCVSVFDKDGKFSPMYDDQQRIEVECSYVLSSIGQSVVWGNLLEGSKVVLNRSQTAQADSLTYQTAEPDVFVGGDVYAGPQFVIDAIAAGKEAAISLHRFVQPGQSLTVGRDRRLYKEIDKKNIVVDDYDHTPRQQVVHAASDDAFRDIRRTFGEDQVTKETQRCLSCGVTVVDTTMCIGCGQCTTKCKFDAIKLEKVFDEHGVTYEKIIPNTLPHAIKRQVKVLATATKEIFTGKGGGGSNA